MNIGFIGAGRAGCSLGKYFSMKEDKETIQVIGYYSMLAEDAKWAAEFTSSQYFSNVDELMKACDTIVLSTPDGAIKEVWDSLKKEQLTGKIICHLSGSLSSDVFSGAEDYGTFPISVHPLVAFSNRDSVYKQLNDVSFTLEGHPYAVKAFEKVFQKLGNGSRSIDKERKAKYHGAASVLSNHVVAVLQTGYDLLVDCGFTDEEARQFSAILVKNNVENVIQNGSVASLTGPIERGDKGTVIKHLSVLNEDQQALYKACGRKLVDISKQKNPEMDYKEIEKLLL